MDFDNFFDWLMNEKKLSKRSAKDVVSRLRRALAMVETEIIDETSLTKLNSSQRFDECSMFIKSQLRRSITLYNEFCVE